MQIYLDEDQEQENGEGGCTEEELEQDQVLRTRRIGC